MKFFRKMILIKIIILVSLLLFSCGGGGQSENGSYQLSFDKNSVDASGSMDTIQIVNGETVTLPQCEFTRPDHVFLGWSDSTDGEFAAFDAEKFTMGSENKVLYAMWDKINSKDDFEYVINSDDTVTIKSYIADQYDPDFDSKIVLPETIEGKPVTEIYDFYHGYGASGTKVTRLYLPANLKRISFRSEINANIVLENVIVDRRNTEFCSVKGVLYSKDKTRLHVVPSGRSDLVFTVPDFVRIIGKYSFTHCKNLLSIILPDTINTIEHGAFEECSGITSMILPPLVNEVPRALFYDCTSLKSVSFRGEILSIGGGAFAGCISLEDITLPRTVEEIGPSAFEDCSSLLQIVIPDRVSVLERNIFASCTALTDITLPAYLKKIDNYAFDRCGSLKYLNLPASLESLSFYGMKKLFNLQAYNVAEGNQYYSSLDGVLFNKDKTVLLSYPRNKTDLRTYVMPYSVREIKGDSELRAFSSAKINNILFSSSLEIIGSGSFEFSSLQLVVIPDSVYEIGSQAFMSCSRLESVYFTRVLPPSLGRSAFYDNDENLKIYVPQASVDDYKNAENWSDYSAVIHGETSP